MSAVWSRLRTVIIMVSVIGPLAGLMVSTYNSLVTHDLARHVTAPEEA
jgi:hypothetical protein